MPSEPAREAGLRHGDLSRHVFDAMHPRFEDYAADPEVRGPARQNTRDALRRVIEYFLYRDLERGWRVTAPNLEDCGLLRFEYEGLGGEDGLFGETELWESGFSVQEGRGNRRFIEVPAALRQAPAEAREEIVRTLLDVLRRALAVKVDVLDPRKQHDLVEQTKPRLLEGTVWYLDDERELTGSVVAWPRPRRKGERGGFFVSSYGAYGTVRETHPRIVSGAGAIPGAVPGAIPRARGHRRGHPVPVPRAEALRHRRAGAHRTRTRRRRRRRRSGLSTQRRCAALAAGRRRGSSARSHAPARRRRASRGGEPLLRGVLPALRGSEARSRSARAHRPGDAGGPPGTGGALPRRRSAAAVLLADHGARGGHRPAQPRQPAQRAAHAGQLRATQRASGARRTARSGLHLLRGTQPPRPVLLPRTRPDGRRHGGAAPHRSAQPRPRPLARPRDLDGRGEAGPGQNLDHRPGPRIGERAAAVAGERGAQGRAAKPGPPGRGARQGRCGDRGDSPGARGDGMVP